MKSRIVWGCLFVLFAGVVPSSASADPPLELVGQWTGGDSYAVALSGNRAYVGMGTSLLIMDVSQPSNPTVLGEVPLAGSVRAIAISGNYAHVADYGAGLKIIDISNPGTAAVVGGYDTAGSALDVAVSGSYAYVADYSNGLEVIDISNPAEPNRIGGYDTSGSAFGVAVSGGYAYVTDYGAGLQVIDVTNPAEPNLIGGYNTVGTAMSVVLSGSYAYVADSWAGLQVIDVSNPELPNRVGGYDTSGDARDVNLWGNYALVADSSAGLQMIDISNPTAPLRVGGYNTSGSAVGVGTSGNYAYVADGSSGLQVIDVSNPASPLRVGGCDTSGTASGVYASANLAYIANGETGLQIVDVSNPASPTLRGICDTSGAALDVAVLGAYVYVADAGSGLQVIDVSNPASPTRIGGYDTASSSQGLALSGDFAYVADYSDGLQIIDVSNPSAPLWAGSYEQIYGTSDVCVRGNYAYVADVYSGLVVLDISDPAHPVLAGSYTTSDYAYGVAVSGSFAFLAVSYDGLEIVDISNPVSPAHAGGYDTNGDARHVALSGTYAYVADYHNGLEVIDFSNPAAPVRVDGFDTSGYARDVMVLDNYVYVADNTAGLAVFRSDYVGVDAPAFSPDGGVFHSEQYVTVSCSTPGATIHYTTNGLDPNENDPVLASGSTIFVDQGLTLKAKAWKDGIQPSVITSAIYQLVVAQPVFTPGGGVYDIDQTVTVTCSTPGAAIHYTTSDLDPNETDPVITSGSSIVVDVNQPTPLKARAFKANFANSAVNRAMYRGQAPVVFHVSTSGNDGNSGLSWETAKSTIQGGIDAALQAGDCVLVAPGTYTGLGNRDIDFLGRAITVSGTDPNDPPTVHTTIIDCQLNGRGFYFHNAEDADSILTGLTIQHGTPTDDEPYGGGIRCYGASPTIASCVIIDNHVGGLYPEVLGGGICCQNGASPLISNCTITGNSALCLDMYAAGGGIAAADLSHPAIVSCLITGNSASGEATWPIMSSLADASGGGIYADDAIDIYDSIITRNQAIGAGITTGEYSQDIWSGSAIGGGICIAGWDNVSTVVNCLVTFNFVQGGYSEWLVPMPGEDPPFITMHSYGTTAGGGIYAWDPQYPNNMIIDNCTVVGNSAPGYPSGPTYAQGTGGGIAGFANAANCIVRSNTPSNQIEAAVAVTYSNVEGGATGAGNIDAAPLFVQDPNAGPDGLWATPDDIPGDVHLQTGSPCVDAGCNAAVPDGVITDLDGNYRFRNDLGTPDTGNGGPPVVDMGALEYQFLPPADLDGDTLVNNADFAILAGQWLVIPCDDDNDWCQGADGNHSGTVDTEDLMRLAHWWLH